MQLNNLRLTFEYYSNKLRIIEVPDSWSAPVFCILILVTATIEMVQIINGFLLGTGPGWLGIKQQKMNIY
jgi:hypothetical protein